MKNHLTFKAQKKKFIQEILPYFSINWISAVQERQKIESILLELSGFTSMRKFLEFISPRTVAVFFHAGSGTRWRESLGKVGFDGLLKEFRIDSNLPRGLAEVDNFLPDIAGEKTVLASYNIYAISRLSNNLIVVSGRRQAGLFKKRIIKPLKLTGKTIYYEQETNGKTGKPLGHGEALRQLFDRRRDGRIAGIMEKARYIITQFEGMPSRRSTAEIALLAMYVTDKYYGRIGWLSPTAVLDTPRYPFRMDKNNRLTGLGHFRLFGKGQPQVDTGLVPNNIGLHVIKTTDLKKELAYISETINRRGFTSLFSRGTGEFALDHLMKQFIKRKKLFILNIADSQELVNEVKTVDKLRGFIDDIRGLMVYEMEPKAISMDDINSHIGYFRQVLRQKPHNFVLLDPNPLTKGIGAGHSRQINMMKMFLKETGGGNNITHLVMSDISRSGFMSQMAFRLYRHIQSRPYLSKTVSFLLNRLGRNESIDSDLKKSDYSSQVMEMLEKSGSFHPHLPTIIIATHVVETVTGIYMLQKKLIKGAVFEYIPDPFPPPLQLQTMSSPITHQNHFIVVHDRYTMDNLLNIRSSIAKEENVFPLGTLSNYRFLAGQIKTGQEKILHLGIEYGGNYLPLFDRKVLEFISANRQEIERGEIRITIHTMYHRKTYDKLISLLSRLNLKYGVRENLRIINTAGSNKSVSEAIESRERYLTGHLDKNWGIPQAVITKGSEVTLEYRGEMLMAVVYGSGHEKLDAEAGFKERRALNLYDISPADWLKKIRAEIDRRRDKGEMSPPPSYAVFGILKYLDSEYFHRNILSKIPGYEN